MAPVRARSSAGFRTAAVFGVALLTGTLTALGSPAAAHADQVRSLEYWLDDDGLRDAWSVSRGAGVTVAVIDTGVAPVPDLAGAVIGGTDESGVGSRNGRTPVGEDPDHGTLVAGLLAGRGTSSTSGVLGAAPAASLLSVSVSLGDEHVGPRTDEQIARGIRWAVDHGASIINLSLTRNTLTWPRSWDRAFRYAFARDVIVVAAAGNRGGGTAEVGAPATIPGVVTVAGVDRTGTASLDASSQGISIAVAAQSEDLVGVAPGGGYRLWSGTSGAAPLVSGVLALIRAAHPSLSAGQVIARLTSTARGAGDRDLYGHGLVDAAAAVRSGPIASVGRSPLQRLDRWVSRYRPAVAAHGEAQADAASPAPIAAPTPAPFRASAAMHRIRAVVVRHVLPLVVLGGFATMGLLGVMAVVRAARRPRR